VTPASPVPGGLDRAALLEHAAEAAYLLAEHDEAIAVARQALTDLASADRLRTAVLLARLALYQFLAGDRNTAHMTMTQAVATIPAEPPSRERATVLAAQGRLLMLLGHNPQAREPCAQAIAVARQVGARAEEGQALNTLGTALVGLGHADDAIAQIEHARAIAREVGDVDGLCRAQGNLAFALSLLGRFPQALSVGLDGCRLARRLGLVGGAGAEFFIDATMVLRLLGRWDEADALIEELFDRDLPAATLAEARYARALSALWRGDLDRAEADLTMITTHSPGPVIVLAARLRAELALARGQLAEARAAVDDGLARADSSAHPLDVLEMYLTGLSVEAAIAEHARARHAAADHRAANDHARRLLTRTRAVAQDPAAAHTPIGTAWLHTAEAEFSRVTGASDPTPWATATGAFQTLGLPYHAAVAGWRHAEALLTTGAPRAHITTVLGKAWQTANTLGARLLTTEITALARRARIELDPPTDPQAPARQQAADTTPAHGLTGRERQVLALLADGRTNRQIAERLYISPKTAGVHVSNILTKLSAANRGEAAAIAHRLGLTN
jgi:DNA-binding CsgD family transcriptional regulator/tetratricopeptide (TPR) repeat protein